MGHNAQRWPDSYAADTRRVVRHALQRESKDLNARTHARTHTRFVRRKPLSSNGGQGERDERPARRADDDASEERLDGRSSHEPDELLLPESITQLEAKGVPMEPEEKTKIVTNLL